MILKKPYAFLIKSFKLIHVLMTLIIAYLIYRSSLILNFFNQYIGSSEIITGKDLTGTLFNFLMFFMPFFLILACIIILSVMYLKKKPFLFYVTNIIVCVAIVIMFTISYSLIGTMEVRIVDVKTIRMVRDLLMMVFVFECISAVIMFVRATGFDLRKFNFGADLAELDIQEEDNEEVEVELNIDTDKLQRKARRRLRYLRYAYVENKFMFHIGILITVATICFVVYFNTTIYSRNYQVEETVPLIGYQFTLHNSYILREDEVKNKIHDGRAYVVLKVSVRNLSNVAKTFPSTRAELVIDGKKFHHISTYQQEMLDLGITYDEQALGNKKESYLLVYEIPEALSSSKMKLQYVDDITLLRGKMSPKYINFHLFPTDLSESKSNDQIKLGTVMDMKDSIFFDSKLKIEEVSIAKSYKEDYQLCITSSECYLSWEYVKPDLKNTYPKALIKMKGNLLWSSKLPDTHNPNLYRFIEQYGTISYELQGATFKMNRGLQQVIPLKAKEPDTYYLEVSEELMKADKIWISFHIRDRDYQYFLKEPKTEQK